jgi:hypothetical protein
MTSGMDYPSNGSYLQGEARAEWLMHYILWQEQETAETGGMLDIETAQLAAAFELNSLFMKDPEVLEETLYQEILQAVPQVMVAMGTTTSDILLSGGERVLGKIRQAVSQRRGPTAYSVAYEMKLDSADYGRSRTVHNNRANAALDAAIQSDPAFAASMEELSPRVTQRVSSRGGRQNPAGYVWHHDQGGAMQLVPKTQHYPGSPWWSILHPDGLGGYSIWAIPSGAPRN